ncbi:DUF2239 family protein [Chelativorans salis]|uniref:DUF2239 family protein n=1 Tax=Chelativorans salis TaxID=2978478 RepID=UPI003CC65E07
MTEKEDGRCARGVPALGAQGYHTAIGGDGRRSAGYEEASRALYAGDDDRFRRHIADRTAPTRLRSECFFEC